MPTELPFIDEWETNLAAPADRVFLSVAQRIGLGFAGLGPRLFSRLLGCENQGATYAVPPIEGQEASGFRVTKVDRPRELILEGQHRFAAYRLSFFVDPMAEGGSRLRARTDAIFPGVRGSVYRALVIGSGGHKFIVKWMLRDIVRQAKRPQNE